jgi:hypothetical protein
VQQAACCCCQMVCHQGCRSITSVSTIMGADCSCHVCPAGCLIAAGSYGRVYAGEEAAVDSNRAAEHSAVTLTAAVRARVMTNRLAQHWNCTPVCSGVAPQHVLALLHSMFWRCDRPSKHDARGLVMSCVRKTVRYC